MPTAFSPIQGKANKAELFNYLIINYSVIEIIVLNMLNQNYLEPGDLLQVISPSGRLRELDAFNKGVEIWRSRGYQVEYLTIT
ncbi:hypothetical protein [Okeania sp. SIO3I5]|uniref:hypothetical protein n=1 Tax=Okeania sp. SIO3I5 TaxID=2607805 RepID=UPI0035C8CB66